MTIMVQACLDAVVAMWRARSSTSAPVARACHACAHDHSLKIKQSNLSAELISGMNQPIKTSAFACVGDAFILRRFFSCAAFFVGDSIGGQVSGLIEYKGFKLMVTVETLLADEAGQRWRGRFGFWKEGGVVPQLCTVSRAERDPVDARKKALRIAKAVIDAERAHQIKTVCLSHDVLARH